MKEFDAKRVTEEVIQWIRDWFEQNGPGCTAVLGMSGGKDSTVAAALCAKALGKDRVIGVAMPDNGQAINDADRISRYIGIRYCVAPIGAITSAMNNLKLEENDSVVDEWTVQTKQNVPPRVRMVTLYAIAQTNNGRVVNTCNLSEDWIGYATRYGDNAGDFSPLSFLTVTEILQIGRVLGLPLEWVDKVPDDGLPHSSPDEVKLGFTYATLDKYIREGIEPELATKAKIDRLHRINLFKVKYMDRFDPEIPIVI